jgi:hypothetical protein
VVAVGLTADRLGRGRREGTSAGGISVLVGVLVVMVMVLMIIMGRRSGDDGSA